MTKRFLCDVNNMKFQLVQGRDFKFWVKFRKNRVNIYIGKLLDTLRVINRCKMLTIITRNVALNNQTPTGYDSMDTPQLPNRLQRKTPALSTKKPVKLGSSVK